MKEQTDKMQTQMAENMKIIQEVGEKNRQFFEESLKTVQQQRQQDRERQVEMIKALQERNAQIAKGRLHGHNTIAENSSLAPLYHHTSCECSSKNSESPPMIRIFTLINETSRLPLSFIARFSIRI